MNDETEQDELDFFAFLIRCKDLIDFNANDLEEDFV
jgi:hypothetical protein